jgi:lysophospholipase
MLDDRRIGHVEDFTDYQKDVAAALRAARALDLPKPWFMLGHSMGGCIGLRAVMEDLPVNAVAFTAPMWGIRIAPHVRPFAWVLSHTMPVIGQGGALPPGTKIESYVLSDPFEDNMLTRDKDMHDMMRAQLEAHPDLALGGPSFVWLREALADTSALSKRAAPKLPCLTYLGTSERIVHLDRIHERMDTWSNGRLEIVQDAEHEVLMEVPSTRNAAFDGIAKFFRDHS